MNCRSFINVDSLSGEYRTQNLNIVGFLSDLLSVYILGGRQISVGLAGLVGGACGADDPNRAFGRRTSEATPPVCERPFDALSCDLVQTNLK